MPVQKEKKYEITFKNLRRREIPCLVIAVPQKNSDAPSGPGPLDAENKTRSKILKRLKQRLNRLSKTPTKKSKSLSCLDRKSETSSKVLKKRVYRKRSLGNESSPRKKSSTDGIDTSPIENDINVETVASTSEAPKKRPYRKKIRVGAIITPITDSEVSKSPVETFFGTPVITPETPKKRVYLKKLKIPAVPHNTPVLCRGSDGDSISNTPFLNHSEVITVGKRGRGRPRLHAPAAPPGSDNGDESTMSLGSDRGSTSRRARRSLWALDSDGEGEPEDQVSEYELLRQRNIEENLKKLREIFTQQGLQFEEKQSDTPKKRKSYSRVPLPPPRPRSQRIEIRKTFMPLDFSKLDEKLTMSEAAFM